MSLEQLKCFLLYFASGVLIAIIFDIFRILRKGFKTSTIATNIEDIIYFGIITVFLMWEIFMFNNGEIRIYIFIALLLGMVFYYITISKTIIKINVKILLKIKNLIKNLYLFIIKPINFINRKIKINLKLNQKFKFKKNGKKRRKKSLNVEK